MKVRTNPFRKIYDYQNRTESSMQIKNVGKFPRLIDVELTNHCNMNCFFCGQRAMTRKKGYLEKEVYDVLLDQVSKYKIPLRFIRWGEPLLHPNFVDYAEKAKKHDILLHVTTNGLLLNKGLSRKLIEMHFDSIKLSLQGVDRETYQEMRGMDKFDIVVTNLETLYELRGDNRKPYIHVSTTITSETPEQVESFERFMRPYADSVEVGRTNLHRYDLLDLRLSEQERATFLKLYHQQSIKKYYKHCPEVFSKLSINYDGSVSACCADYDNIFVIGHLKTQSLEEIWVNEQMQEIRNILARHQHSRLSLCKKCYIIYDNKSVIVK